MAEIEPHTDCISATSFSLSFFKPPLITSLYPGSLSLLQALNLTLDPLSRFLCFFFSSLPFTFSQSTASTSYYNLHLHLHMSPCRLLSSSQCSVSLDFYPLCLSILRYVPFVPVLQPIFSALMVSLILIKRRVSHCQGEMLKEITSNIKLWYTDGG